MYDSLHFFLKAEDCPQVDIPAEVPLLLENQIEGYNHWYKCITTSGMYKKFHLSVSARGVLFCGSLCKYYLGQNQSTLTFPQIKAAFERLSGELNLPIEKAFVYRLDIAENYIMEHPEQVYLDLLGNTNRYYRNGLGNGVYYTKRQSQLLFYGKVTEQQKKRIAIQPGFIEKHVLRYEFRLLKDIPKQLGRKELRVGDLYDEDFYIELLNLYKKSYAAIHKPNLINFDPTVVINAKRFQKQLCLLGIQKLGGELAVLDILDRAEHYGAYKNAMQKKRLKDKVRNLGKTPDLTHPADELKELDKKIFERIEKELLAVKDKGLLSA